MNAIVLALGGVRATAFAAIALLLLAGVGVQTARLKAAQADYDGYKDKVITATAKAQVAAQKAQEAAAVAREAYYWKSAEAENNYESGRQSAIHAQETMLADLRAERIGLRREWQSCLSRSAQGGDIGPASGQDDADADLRQQSASRVFGYGDQADLWIVWLQTQLTATRTLAESCNKAD